MIYKPEADNKLPNTKIDPKVKDVLLLLAGGTFIAASLIFPGLPIIAKEALKVYNSHKREKRQKEWKKYNTWRLRQVIKRLQKQKLVEIINVDEQLVVKISDRGRQKVLKYDLEIMVLDQTNWDGKWRIITYDIATAKKWQRQFFRQTLNRMNFLKLQRSVYLTPFKCINEIEYLRQICEVGNEVILLTVHGIENEQAYKEYFGLD